MESHYVLLAASAVALGVPALILGVSETFAFIRKGAAK